MKIKIIISFVLAIICAGLSYTLYDSINGRHNEIERVTRVEEAIKSELRLIRDAQEAYLQTNGEFASSWGTLRNFCVNGKMFITERREEIFPNTPYYGVDSIAVIIDTVKTVSVQDTLFNNNPSRVNYDIQTLGQIPESDKEFALYTTTMDGVAAYEIKDTAPINKERQEGRLDTLRLGSKEIATTRGSWEK